MTALKIVTGDLVDNDQIARAKELDRKIRECIRDYVDLGKHLMEMRDGQQYRLLGPYDTFEDYVKDVEGLSYSVAQEKIKHYLVHTSIVSILGPEISGPTVEHQVRMLTKHDTAIAKFKTERREVKTKGGQKRVVEVPVAVSNPKKVAEQWAAIVKEHEKAVERAKVAHEKKVEDAKAIGKPAPPFKKPPLSGNFVVNSLPPQYQPPAKVKADMHEFTKQVNNIAKAAEILDGYLGHENQAKWDRAVAMPHRKQLDAGVRAMIIQDADEAIEILEMFKKELIHEFSK